MAESRSGEDVLAFLIAGASAVQIGTSTLIHPAACETITEEIISIADELNISVKRNYRYS